MGKGQKRFHEPKSAEKPSEQGKETNRQLPQASDEAKGSPQHKAFKEMLRRCDSTIIKICLMFTDRCPENVKDLYQDIVCALWESWPRFRHESKENTWFYRIALNIAVSKSRHHSLSPMFSPLDDKTYNNLAEESQNHLVERLYELIDLLSPNEKAILFLYLDGITAREIGATLKISEAAVNHRIARIKDKLKALNISFL